MRGFTDHRRVIAVGDDQPGLRGEVLLLLEQTGEVRRDRPEEAIALVEIIEPFAVADQVGLGDLDLDNRQPALGIDRHQVGAAPVG